MDESALYFIGGSRNCIALRQELAIMRIELEQEDDGRWIAEMPELPGVMAYGTTRNEAICSAKVLALRVMADRLEHGEELPEMNAVFVIAA